MILENNKRVALIARIDPKIREDFRIKTIREKTTMAEVVEELIKKYLEEK